MWNVPSFIGIYLNKVPVSGPNEPSSKQIPCHKLPLFYLVNIHSSLAMNSSNTAIGALILVPIVIAASAAFIALKTQRGFQAIAQFCSRHWSRRRPWTRLGTGRRGRKQRRSDLPSNQLYGDSWCDLESIRSSSSRPPAYTSFTSTSPRRKSLSERSRSIRYSDSPSTNRTWHPTRSNRLSWSFTDPTSQNLNPFESSSVVRPSPVATRQERFSAEDGVLRVHPTRAREARQWAATDL